MLLYFLLIVGFTYFYVAITFNPEEVADNMKKYGGFIPGIRAGRPTAEYLDYVLTRITLPGSIYLGLIALIPLIALAMVGAEPELPVRRRIDPDHRRCRPRDGEADRRPAPAAPLRRTPPMTAPATGSARFLIVGPQGSGKGTQGVLVAEAFGIPQVSTGDIFRENVKSGTELGKRVKAIVEAGDLVPDELTSELVRDRLQQPDAAGGFLLDGYPRNRGQVDDLDDVPRLARRVARRGHRARRAA